MVVVALLDQPDLIFEPQCLFAIFAERAIHGVGAVQDLPNPFGEGIKHQGMVVEVGRLDELNVRMAGRDDVDVVIDALDQDAGEQEIGKDDDPFVAELGGMIEGRFGQRESNSGITGLGPAEALALPKKAGDF